MPVAPPAGPQAGTEDQIRVARAYTYTRHTARLVEGVVDGVTAAAYFDVALTHGLLLVVASLDPTKVPRPKKPDTIRSAKELLDYIESRHGPCSAIAVTGHGGWIADVTVDVTTFREALKHTGPLRHGGDGQAPEPRHVEALQALAAHPDIGSVESEIFERVLQRERNDDEMSRDQAANLVARLTDEEVERRADPEVLQTMEEPVDGGDLWLDFDDCPVCLQTALQPTGYDDYGGLHSAGQCLVCGYQRSALIAYFEGTETEIDRLLDRDSKHDPN